jgi:hypothetical protein
VTGTVYLLHFDRPYKHARHYTGWAASSRSLKRRLAQHGHGDGARLLAVAHAAGIGWQLARTWPGDRTRERQIKRQGGASRHCPLCGVKPRRAAAVAPDDGGEEYTRALTELAADMWRRVHEALAAPVLAAGVVVAS